tara:strand:- start:3406 stop:4104 length:699 start_codon:yes stop_codon:yes gene_type:complete
MIKVLVIRDKILFILAKIFLNSFESFYFLPSHQINVILKIKTNEIKNFIKHRYIENLPKNKFVWKGGWDKHTESLKTYKNYNINYYSMFEIFKKKRDYKTCIEYLKKKKMIKNEGFDSRGHKSIKELNNYFESLKKVKKSLKINGYLSQRKMKKKNPEDEIGVFIDRKGQFLKPEDKFGGTHRFAISKILKVKYIYVRVRATHMNYLKKIFFSKKKLSKNDRILIKSIKKLI